MFKVKTYLGELVTLLYEVFFPYEYYRYIISGDGLCDPYLPDSSCIRIPLYEIDRGGLLMRRARKKEYTRVLPKSPNPKVHSEVGIVQKSWRCNVMK